MAGNAVRYLLSATQLYGLQGRDLGGGRERDERRSQEGVGWGWEMGGGQCRLSKARYKCLKNGGEEGNGARGTPSRQPLEVLPLPLLLNGKDSKSTGQRRTSQPRRGGLTILSRQFKEYVSICLKFLCLRREARRVGTLASLSSLELEEVDAPPPPLLVEPRREGFIRVQASK